MPAYDQADHADAGQAVRRRAVFVYIRALQQKKKYSVIQNFNTYASEISLVIDF
jgi:hypothetical protein